MKKQNVHLSLPLLITSAYLCRPVDPAAQPAHPLRAATQAPAATPGAGSYAKHLPQSRYFCCHRCTGSRTSDRSLLAYA